MQPERIVVSSDVSKLFLNAQRVILKYPFIERLSVQGASGEQLELLMRSAESRQPEDILTSKAYQLLLAIEEDMELIGQSGIDRNADIDSLFHELDAKYTQLAEYYYRRIMYLYELMLSSRLFGYTPEKRKAFKEILTHYPVHPKFVNRTIPAEGVDVYHVLQRCRLASKKGIIDGSKHVHSLPELLQSSPYLIPEETQLDLIIMAEVNRLRPIIHQVRAGIMFDDKKSRLINYASDVLGIVTELMEAKERLVTEEKLLKR